MKWLRGKVRRKIIQYLVKNLLVAINEDDILTITGKDWLFKKRKLTAEEILMLKDEASSFSSSLLWKIMRSELQWLSNEQMFTKLQRPEDMEYGKAMLYNLDLMRKYINKIRNL